MAARNMPMVLTLVALSIQYNSIQSIPIKDETMLKAPREILRNRLAKQWEMGAPIKLSEEQKKKMTMADYNILVREIVEDSNGSHLIDLEDLEPFKKKLSTDRHFHIGRNGEINKLPSFKRKKAKLNKPDNNTPLKPMASTRRKRASMKAKYRNYLSWENAVVPYITTNMRTGDNFLSWISESVNNFHEESCLEWKERTGEIEYVDFLGGNQDGFCAAYVGRLHDRPSPIYLDQITGNCEALGVVVHEMLHAIGFDHEQSRPDRYDWLIMNWQCIMASAIDNYVKQPLATNVEFDWTSIMQYTPDIFNNCTNIGTMETTNPAYDRLLYLQLDYLTHYDSQTLVEAYGCNAGCTDTCKNGGFIRRTVKNKQCHCRCPDYLAGPTCDALSTSCGEIIQLGEGEKRQITTSNPYPVGETCVYLIKAPVNNRIVIKRQRIDVPCGLSLQNGHFVEYRVNLIAQQGLLECGSSTSERTFVTFPNSESNTAMIILNAQSNTISPGSGISLEVESFRSNCVNNPCRNGAVCEEDVTHSFSCECPPGYSGDTCNVVSATATVGCDLLTDIEGICCFTDVSTGTVEFSQVRPQSYITSPYLQADTIGIYTKTDEARLETNVEFGDGVRCLTFYDAVIRDNDSNAKVRSTYVDRNGNEQLLFETTDTSGYFVWRQATLPWNLEKITFASTIYNGAAGISDIKISPGQCSDTTCASLAFAFCDNGGTCVDSTDTLTCDCTNTDFIGTYCQIPRNSCDGVTCSGNGNCVVDPVSGATCNCINGFTGTDCQTPPISTRCLMFNRCQNGGHCNTAFMTLPSYSFKCTFETRETSCPFLNLPESNHPWRSQKGATKQKGTGPSRAYSGEVYYRTDGKRSTTTSTLKLKSDRSAQGHCLIINYNMNGRHIESLVVRLDDSELFTVTGNKGNNWYTEKVDVTTRPDSELTIEGSSSGRKGDIAIDEIEMLPFSCDKIVICTFETSVKPCRRGKGHWSKINLPKIAHDGYSFLRSQRIGKAILRIDVPETFNSGDACLSFYYMFGQNVGNLSVYTRSPGGGKPKQRWNLSGDNGNQWLLASVNIPNLTDQVSIVAAASDESAHIAIDTVTMTNHACS